MSPVYKIGICIPEEYLEKLMDSLDSVIGRDESKYSRVFSYWPVKGTWRTMDGAHPFNGVPGEITVADEIRVEFIINEELLKKTISAVVKCHPYEEPAIDIIPMADWKGIIVSDDT